MDSSFFAKYRRYRFLRDKVTTVTVTIGGLSVVGTLLLIFLYLFSEVTPLLKGAEIHQVNHYSMLNPGETTRYVAMEEQAEIAFRLTAEGNALFWQAQTGESVREIRLPIPEGASISVVEESTIDSGILILGLSSGEVLIVKHHYRTRYPNDERVITPSIEYPYGSNTFVMSSKALTKVAIRDDEEKMTLAALDNAGGLSVIKFQKEEDFLSGEVVLEKTQVELTFSHGEITELAIDSDQHWLFFIENHTRLNAVDLYQDVPVILDSYAIEDEDNRFVDMTLLLGGISLLTVDTQGSIIQWFMVRNTQGPWSLQPVREFSNGSLSNGSSAEATLIAEHRRKGFLSYRNLRAGSGKGSELVLYHSTAHRELLREELPMSIDQLGIAPRANALIVLDSENQASYWTVENEHPDISWSALWDEIWYESYRQPGYIWQSSSASSDFEPKFSLTPLAFGTLKAAFYTLLLAAPLAICGAIYTAYFMAPALRRKVKPLIELMEALPTVILGFLAGIWLAPFIENNLTGMFLLFLSLPVTVFLSGYFWHRMPSQLRCQVPDGWEAALLIPMLLFAIGGSLYFATGLESAFFEGDMRSWITHELGISFDQRNALVVGIAMGLAVIPTIFSIAEDAIFSVPRHLSNGSLALGASPWQTLVGVVLPTASPSLFSALMIGMGRAVGETMIVLMATGNTPIMDANIFEGMRTLSANIAVEVPEAEVGSTHFRVLYLSAFFLFLFTFVVNTVAEVVRQRLRKRYSSL
ncbi:MAG: ABC transporter permease subunit [Pseudomonadales bacterium]|nr:ABC transporter permease subunit [Pseudomonadales bacterium]